MSYTLPKELVGISPAKVNDYLHDSIDRTVFCRFYGVGFTPTSAAIIAKQIDRCPAVVRQRLKLTTQYLTACITRELKRKYLLKAIEGKHYEQVLLIHFFDFSNRLRHCLDNAEFLTLDQLLSYNSEKLLKYRGFGVGLIEQIIEKLDAEHIPHSFTLQAKPVDEERRKAKALAHWLEDKHNAKIPLSAVKLIIELKWVPEDVLAKIK